MHKVASLFPVDGCTVGNTGAFWEVFWFGLQFLLQSGERNNRIEYNRIENRRFSPWLSLISQLLRGAEFALISQLISNAVEFQEFRRLKKVYGLQINRRRESLKSNTRPRKRKRQHLKRVMYFLLGLG